MGKPHSRSGLASSVASTNGISNAACNQVVGACGSSTRTLVLVNNASQGADPVKDALCKIFCKTRSEWQACRSSGRTNCEKPSKTAARRTKRALDNPKSALRKGLASGFPGAVGRAEKSFLAAIDGAARKVLGGARKVYDEAALKRAIERKIKQVAKRKALQKGAKMASRAWLKLVPGLNVIMTAVDVIDIAMTAADLIKMVRGASKIAENAIRIKPDFAVEAADGSVSEIYDYKFDAPKTDKLPKYQDGWQKGNKQWEAYREATGKNPNEISNASCGCDKGPKSTKGLV